MEVVLALLLVSVGVLGGLGSIALAWRNARTGDDLADAARRTSLLLDSLRQRVSADGASCTGLSSGRDSSASATLSWTVVPAAGGVGIALTIATPRGTGDTGWTFLPCRP